MAMIKCKECGNEVSIKAYACPNCGAFVKNRALTGCGPFFLVCVVVLSLVGFFVTNDSTNSDDSTKNKQNASVIQTVGQNIKDNKLGISESQLLTKKNPKGEGTFVYSDRVIFSGRKRYIFWLVIDNQAFPVNGDTKGFVTPNLPYPRETPESLWTRTGLDPLNPSEAIYIVFDLK